MDIQEEHFNIDVIYFKNVQPMLHIQIGILTCILSQLTFKPSMFFKLNTIMNGLATNLIEISSKENIHQTNPTFGKLTHLLISVHHSPAGSTQEQSTAIKQTLAPPHAHHKWPMSTLSWYGLQLRQISLREIRLQ